MPSKHALSISLTEHLALFVRSEIAGGRYRTASEVIRAGLRLLEGRQSPVLCQTEEPVSRDAELDLVVQRVKHVPKCERSHDV